VEAKLDSPRANWLRRGLWLALTALAFLLLFPLGRFIAGSSAWLDYPYSRPGSEGLILYESLLVKHGGDIYGPITPQRFISGPYPPVYYWLAADLLPDRLPDFSDSAGVTSIFRPGRSISLLAALLAAALLPLLVIFDGGYNAHGRNTTLGAALAGFVGGVLLLTLPQVIVWATRFRGDMLMVAFTAAGLTCIAVGAPNRLRNPYPGMQASGDSEDNIPHSALRTPHSKWPWLVLAAIFFALAFFTKQTALAGPLAAAAYLLLRGWRKGLLWCAAMALLVAVPFALLDLATNHWFYLKMVDYHSLPLRQLTLVRLLQFAFWEDQWPIVLLAAAYALFRLLQAFTSANSRSVARVPVLIPLFALATFATLPSGSVIGADHNHLLLPGLAVCACVGAALASALFSNGPGLPVAAVGATAAVILLVVYALFTAEPSSWYNPDLVIPTTAQQEQLRKIVFNVHQNPGELFFADDPGMLALAGKQTPFDDPFTMTALAPVGRWGESAFRDMLRQGKFSLLILSCDVNVPDSCRADTLSPGMIDAIRTGYRVLFRDVLFTYAPK
jgi:hypothetical protein